MPFTTTLIYPNTPKLNFNADYYASTHWPLVEKHWRSFGILDWEAHEVGKLPDGSNPPYTYVAIINWKDKASFESLQKSGQPFDTVMADIPNFSGESPVLLAGDAFAQSS